MAILHAILLHVVVEVSENCIHRQVCEHGTGDSISDMIPWEYNFKILSLSTWELYTSKEEYIHALPWHINSETRPQASKGGPWPDNLHDKKLTNILNNRYNKI